MWNIIAYTYAESKDCRPNPIEHDRRESPLLKCQHNLEILDRKETYDRNERFVEWDGDFSAVPVDDGHIWETPSGRFNWFRFTDGIDVPAFTQRQTRCSEADCIGEKDAHFVNATGNSWHRDVWVNETVVRATP